MKAIPLPTQTDAEALQAAAEHTRGMYLAYVAVGFTEAQALRITIDVMTAHIQAMAALPPPTRRR